MKWEFVARPAPGDATNSDYLRLEALPVRSQSTLTLP